MNKTFTIEKTEIPYAKFVSAWQKSTSTKEVCERLKILYTSKTCRTLSNRAGALRRKGLPLVRFSPRQANRLTDDDLDYLKGIIGELQ